MQNTTLVRARLNFTFTAFGLVVVAGAYLAPPVAPAAPQSRPRAVTPAGAAEEPATMTNDSLAVVPPPLPENWPVGVRDAHFRGAVCENGYGAGMARKKAVPGDDVLPIAAKTIPGVPGPYVAVRRLPFLTRRDVLTALFAPAADGTYEVTLKLTEDGAKKIQEYTKAHENECIALVAGGKVIWHPTLSTPVTDDTFVLSGSFSVAQAQAIVSMFAP
jgi:hypothetical protein